MTLIHIDSVQNQIDSVHFLHERINRHRGSRTIPERTQPGKKKPVRITRHGKDIAIIIDPSLYESLIEAQEELDDIAAFDEAMEDKSPNIPWSQVQKDLQLI